MCSLEWLGRLKCRATGLDASLSSFTTSLYGGQFTLSTPLINQIFVFHFPHRRRTTVSLETNPLYLFFNITALLIGYSVGFRAFADRTHRSVTDGYQHSRCRFLNRNWTALNGVLKCCFSISIKKS